MAQDGWTRHSRSGFFTADAQQEMVYRMHTMRYEHTQRLYRLAIATLLIAAQPADVKAAAGPYRAEVVKVEDLTHDVKRIRFKAQEPDRFRFNAGQFVLLHLPESHLAEFNRRHGTSHKDVARPYSFASSPSELPYFDLIIKRYPAPRGKDVPPGLASTYVHTKLKPGTAVTFSDPIGNLYLGGESKDPIICVAGGVGVSPFVGLLKYWFDEGINEKRKIYLYLGVRSKRDLLLDSEFKQWAKTKKQFAYVAALSRPEESDQWTGETGYINLVLDKHFDAPLKADVYLAGSPIMLRETVKVLKAKGLTDGRIHHDPIEVK